MVIDRGAFLAGHYLQVFDEIVAVKEACGSAHLKVIFETGELQTYDNVRRASWLAMLAGTDFIKTSTGKVQPAATLPVTLVMLEAVRDFREATGVQIGVKPAGGIRNAKDAIKYLVMVNEVAGPDWLTPDWFRFGASTLLNDILMQRTKLDHRPLQRSRLLHPGLRKMTTFEYAPAPESRAIVDIKPSYGLFIDGEFVDGHGNAVQDGQPGDRGDPRRDRRGRRGRRRPRGQGRAQGVPRLVADARPGAVKYLYRIARIIQERSRELAVLESIDNGKPIKESRDVDVPIVAAHFFYHAGWADKLEYAGLGPDPQPLGVAGQVIPWNFPLLMLAWKIAPALACGNTVVLKPAETTPLTALLFAEICQQADLPPGVVNIVTGAGGDRPGPGDPPRRRQGRVHRARPGSARRSPEPSPAPTRRRRSSSAARPPTSCSTTPPIDQAVEGIVSGIFFNQGHVCCAGSRLLLQESVADEVMAKLKRRMGTLRVGDPLDKNTDIGAINSAAQLARIRALAEIGEDEGAERWSPPCELPSAGYWFPPTVFTGVSQAHRIAREEIFGPVLSVLTFRTPAEAVEKANNTPYGLSAGVWTEKGSLILPHGRPAPRRRGVGQHVQQVRPGQPVRWLQGVGLRPRRRPPGPRRLPEGWCLMARIDVRKTYKLYIGGAFPRSESGHSYEVQDSKGKFVANAAKASRKDVRDAVVAARKAFPGLVRAHRLQPRPDPLPDRRGHGGPPAAVRAGRPAVRGRHRRRRRPPGRRGHRPAGLVRRLGRQARPGRRQRQPGGRAVLQPLRAGADRRRRGARAPVVVAARSGERRRAGHRHRQHRGRRVVVLPAAAGRHLRRGAGDLRRARVAWSTC